MYLAATKFSVTVEVGGISPAGSRYILSVTVLSFCTVQEGRIQGNASAVLIHMDYVWSSSLPLYCRLQSVVDDPSTLSPVCDELAL